jgi:hypothetical protein
MRRVKDPERNRRIMQLVHQGLSPRDVALRLKPIYPDVTWAVVHGVSYRELYPVRAKPTKFDEAQVKLIRANYQRGHPIWGIRGLCRTYSCSPDHMSDIVHGRAYAHVGGLTLTREELRRHRAVLRKMYGLNVKIITLTDEVIFEKFFGPELSHVRAFRWCDNLPEQRHCKCVMTSGGETWDFPVLSHYSPAAVEYIFRIDLPYG